MNKIVCLCGSTKFAEEFMFWNMVETLKGNIVLSVGCFGHRDIPRGISSSMDCPGVKEHLDNLHKTKISMADEILVINRDNYIGSSTRSEIIYAQSRNKVIRYTTQYLDCETMETSYSVPMGPVNHRLAKVEWALDYIDSCLETTSTEGNPDEVEERVVSMIRSRRDMGREKYGTSMERDDLSFTEWVQHLQEELLDASIYAEKMKSEAIRVTPDEEKFFELNYVGKKKEDSEAIEFCGETDKMDRLYFKVSPLGKITPQ